MPDASNIRGIMIAALVACSLLAAPSLGHADFKHFQGRSILGSGEDCFITPAGNGGTLLPGDEGYVPPGNTIDPQLLLEGDEGYVPPGNTIDPQTLLPGDEGYVPPRNPSPKAREAGTQNNVGRDQANVGRDQNNTGRDQNVCQSGATCNFNN